MVLGRGSAPPSTIIRIPHYPAEADKSEGGRGLGGGEDGFVSTII